MFANRFEPDGDGYVFRTNPAAKGYRVSAAERDAFVADFDRRCGWISYAVAALAVVAFLAIEGMFSVRRQSVPDIALLLLFLGVTVAFFIPFYWFWWAPMRALRNRAPADPGRDKRRVRREALQRLPWIRIAGPAGFILLVAVREGPRLLVGWNRIWLALFAATLLLLAVRAVEKLQAGRGP